MRFMFRAAPIIVLIIVVLGLTLLWDLFVDTDDRQSQNFFHFKNLGNILRNNADIGFLALGMTFVIICGGIDLSVGSALALSCMLLALVIKAGYPLAAVGVGLLTGAAIGAANGSVVSFGNIPSFIATLATMVICRGLSMIVHDGRLVELGGSVPQPFEFFKSNIGDVLPISGIFFLVSVAVVYFVLQRTTFGRHVYAVGGNEEAARLCGIRTKTIKIMVFMISGLLAGIAALFYTARLKSGEPRAGSMYELHAIAIVVIGGTSLAGGKGSVLGTLYGFFLIGILNNILTMRNVSSDLQLVVVGVVLVGAALLQTRRV
jgi:ribose transport system permease protein